jgi:phage repressor protein C with HTH and peptisase S24 domain
LASCGGLYRDAPLGRNPLPAVQHVIHGRLLDPDDVSHCRLAPNQVFRALKGFNSNFNHVSKIDFSIAMSIDIPIEPAIELSIIVPAMETYGQRVRAAREHAKLSQGKLASALEIKQPSLHSIETSPTAKSSKYTLAIARATGVRHDWLESGKGEMASGEPPAAFIQPPAPAETTDLNIRAMPLNLPVIGSAACGDDGLFEMQGQVLDHVRRPPRLMGVQDAYALYVHGESMAPWREHGGLVYVHPHMPVKIMDYVVVQLVPAGADATPAAYIKRLVKRTADYLMLLQYNPNGDVKLPTRKVKAVHHIMDWPELMGF